MLIIFPNTMGLFQVKSFVSKMNMRTSQFDGKQEFIHIVAMMQTISYTLSNLRRANRTWFSSSRITFP